MSYRISPALLALNPRYYAELLSLRFNILMTGTWHVKHCIIIIIIIIGRSITTITDDNNRFPTPFHVSPKTKCGLFPQHHGHRVNCRCNHDFVCLKKYNGPEESQWPGT